MASVKLKKYVAPLIDRAFNKSKKIERENRKFDLLAQYLTDSKPFKWSLNLISWEGHFKRD